MLQVFSDLLNVLACITEREAANLAVTLKILLSDVTRWQVRSHYVQILNCCHSAYNALVSCFLQAAA